MVASSCLDEIQKAAGRKLSDEELTDLLEELQRRQRRAQAASAGDLEGAALKAAEDYATDLKAQATIEKRNAALNVKRRLEAEDFIRSQFADRPDLGLEALMVGVNRVKKGSRFSAAAEQNQLAGYYVGGMIADVERAGLWPHLIRGELDRDIARALWQRGQDAPNMKGIPKEAQQLGEIIHKWQEVARLDANKAGAWIKKLPGYIVRQSHDINRIRRAGFEEWRDFILPKLDARTFDDVDDIGKYLAGVYDGLASGVHLKTSSAPTGLKGTANVGRKMSHERSLHFKSADDWSDYNERFGAGSLREALLQGLERSAASTGLMRTLGPNAEANLKEIMTSIMRSLEGQPDRLKAFRDDENWLTNRFKELDGSTRIPANSMGAQVSASVRAVQSMSKLGGSVISAFSDVPIYASEMRYQGRSMLSGMGEALAGLTRGRGSREQREILGMLGVYFDSMRGAITSRFSGHDDLPGKMSRLMQSFFKWNGLTWWTDTMRASAALGMSHRLAQHKDRAWAALDTDLQRTLGLYGIDPGKWEIVRSAAAKQADGRQYIVPEAVRDLGDEPFAAYLTAGGFKPTEAKIRELRREIEAQLRSYFVDRAEYAVIMPDQRTHAIMRRGTRPGTVEGEALRFIGQFKSFPIAVIQKAVGREVYGRGSDTLRQALRNGNGEMLGLAQLMVWTTLFGYGAMTTKDLLKGKTPRDPLSPKTWAAALTQGGGAGIYGDFLLGETSRFGGGLLQTVAGPTLGAVDDFHDLYTRLRNGDDAAAQGFRFLINNTPFANLFYTRTALDYLFLHALQESLNPGYLKRLERRVEKEQGQTFLLRPTESLGVR